MRPFKTPDPNLLKKMVLPDICQAIQTPYYFEPTDAYAYVKNGTFYFSKTVDIGHVCPWGALFTLVSFPSSCPVDVQVHPTQTQIQFNTRGDASFEGAVPVSEAVSYVKHNVPAGALGVLNIASTYSNLTQLDVVFDRNKYFIYSSPLDPFTISTRRKPWMVHFVPNSREIKPGNCLELKRKIVLEGPRAKVPKLAVESCLVNLLQAGPRSKVELESIVGDIPPEFEDRVDIEKVNDDVLAFQPTRLSVFDMRVIDPDIRPLDSDAVTEHDSQHYIKQLTQAAIADMMSDEVLPLEKG